MPLFLVIPPTSSPSGTGRSIPLTSGRVTIGRGVTNDARLEDPSVDEHHATLERRGKDWVLIDHGSAAGSSIGGIALRKGVARVVRVVDALRIGSVKLTLVRSDTSIPSTPSIETRELALRALDRELERDVVPVVRVVEGVDLGSLLRLAEEGREYVVGRGSQCDLPLKELDVSREHVRLTWRDGRVLVRDLGSTQGTWFGRESLKPHSDAIWDPPTHMIRVGNTVLALEEPATTTLFESGVNNLDDAASSPVSSEAIPSQSRPSDADAHLSPPGATVEPALVASAPASLPSASGPIAELNVPAGPTHSLQVSNASSRTPERKAWIAMLVILSLTVAFIGWLFVASH